MKFKKIKILTVFFLVLFLFVQTAGAFVPAAVALGIVLRTASGVIISHVVRHQLAYSILGGILTGLGYVTYDRGTSVDPAKRYVNVPLTEAKAFIDSRRVSLEAELNNVVWSTGVTAEILVYTTLYSSGLARATPYPVGSMACAYLVTAVSVFNSQITASTFEGYSSAAYSYAQAHIDFPIVPYRTVLVCPNDKKAAYPLSGLPDKIYTNADLRKYYQEALGRDLSKAGVVEAVAPASNTMIINMGGDVYETNNYTDARSAVESAIESAKTQDTEITKEAVEEVPVPPVSDGSCGEYQYKNDWSKIKTDISAALLNLPLYGLINKLADLTGQGGFPHQYTLDLSSVGLGRPSLDLDAWHILDVLAVLRWAVLAGSFILAWRIALGGD